MGRGRKGWPGEECAGELHPGDLNGSVSVMYVSFYFVGFRAEILIDRLHAEPCTCLTLNGIEQNIRHNQLRQEMQTCRLPPCWCSYGPRTRRNAFIREPCGRIRSFYRIHRRARFPDTCFWMLNLHSSRVLLSKLCCTVLDFDEMVVREFLGYQF